MRIQNLNKPDAPFNYCNIDVAEKFHIDSGDLLISWSGTPGTSFGAYVWGRGRAVLNQHLFRCEIYGNVLLNEFARIAINGRLDALIAQAHGGVGLQHVTKGKLERLPVVLPPLNEQRRIVARVDELMALCDTLEKRQQRRAGARTRLSRSGLHHLATADVDTLHEHWKRIRESFHLLYNTPEAVVELRRAVLQLAIRGKIVPQNSADEPASVLLERIAAERARLIEKGEMRPPNLGRGVTVEKVPFDLPDGWVWARFGSVAHQRLGKMLDKNKNKGDLHPYLRNTNVQWFRFDLLTSKRMRFNPDEQEEYRLAEGDLLICEGEIRGEAPFGQVASRTLLFRRLYIACGRSLE